MTITSPIEPDVFPWYDPRGFTFSLALRHGADVWCSGHSGSSLDPATGRPDVAGGMAEQAGVAYAKQAAVLAAAGLDFSHVTRVVENVTVAGLPHYAEAEAVRRELFGAHRPVVVTVVVDRLVRRKALIEVEVHATADPPSDRPAEVRVEHGGTVLLPSLTPVDADGAVVAPGDPAGQYRYCLEEAARLLDGIGLDLGSLVSAVEFLSPEAQRAAADLDRVRCDLPGPVFPAGTRVHTQAQLRPGVLVSLEATASRHPATLVDPRGLADPTMGRSPAVRAGGLLFLSGLAAPPGVPDLRGQAETLYGRLLHTMQAVGAGPEHLLSTVEFVAADALADYREVAEVRRALLKEPYPVSTGIVCTGTAYSGALLDVAAVAAIPEGA
ncbi:RidA family protein [Yinghuangia seranimata]|uniref:RidA family protein n=1 Tax=Yinghuangia seranimata TaxID=408067 RepID=UPI00248C8E78|nr:RidA family protein [Yinghuangia seranimata]MDI2132451.1 RidA family protein [Yinghuangia seranimata]